MRISFACVTGIAFGAVPSLASEFQLSEDGKARTSIVVSSRASVAPYLARSQDELLLPREVLRAEAKR